MQAHAIKECKTNGSGIKHGLPSTIPRKPSSQFVSLMSTCNVVPFRTVGSEFISSKAARMASAETPPVVELNRRIEPILTTEGLAAKLLRIPLGKRNRETINNMRNTIFILAQIVQRLLWTYADVGKLSMSLESGNPVKKEKTDTLLLGWTYRNVQENQHIDITNWEKIIRKDVNKCRHDGSKYRNKMNRWIGESKESNLDRTNTDDRFDINKSSLLSKKKLTIAVIYDEWQNSLWYGTKCSERRHSWYIFILFLERRETTKWYPNIGEHSTKGSLKWALDSSSEHHSG